MEARCISLWQPWASLIMTGAKTYETRSWETSYRGPLVICAAKRRVARELAAYLEDEEFKKGLAGKTVGDLPFGCALCVVELAACIPTEEIHWQEIRNERGFGDYSPGRFGWKLEKLRSFKAPIPIVGRQGLFKPPREVITALHGLHAKERCIWQLKYGSYEAQIGPLALEVGRNKKTGWWFSVFNSQGRIGSPGGPFETRGQAEKQAEIWARSLLGYGAEATIKEKV